MVPGGGLSQERDAWLPSRANFSVPVQALSPIYRAIFKEEMRTAGLLAQIDPPTSGTPLERAQPGRSRRRSSLPYLAPYVFKVAISNRRLVSPAGPPRHLHLSQTRQYTSSHHPTRRPGVYAPLPATCPARGLHAGPTLWLYERHLCIATPDIRRMMAETHGATPETTPQASRPLSSLLLPTLWRGVAGRHAGAACSWCVCRYGVRSGHRDRRRCTPAPARERDPCIRVAVSGVSGSGRADASRRHMASKRGETPQKLLTMAPPNPNSAVRTPLGTLPSKQYPMRHPGAHSRLP